MGAWASWHLPRAHPQAQAAPPHGNGCHHSVGYTRHEGYQPGLREPLKGLSFGCIETSDLKRKVATLERELKQQQESTQAVGEEPCPIAPDHVPCALVQHDKHSLSLSPGLLRQR